jgi:hypothetical protein
MKWLLQITYNPLINYFYFGDLTLHYVVIYFPNIMIFNSTCNLQVSMFIEGCFINLDIINDMFNIM